MVACRSRRDRNQARRVLDDAKTSGKKIYPPVVRRRGESRRPEAKLVEARRTGKPQTLKRELSRFKVAGRMGWDNGSK